MRHGTERTRDGGLARGGAAPLRRRWRAQHERPGALDSGGFRAVVERAAEVILVHDPDGRVRYANLAFTRCLGHASAPWLDRSLLSLVHPDDLRTWRADVAAVLATPGGGRLVRGRLRHANASWRHVEGSIVNHLDTAGIDGLVLTLRDVTEERQDDESVRLLAEHSNDWLSRHAPDGTILFASPAVRSLLGYEPEEIVGTNGNDLLHPDDRRVLADARRMALTRDVFTITARTRHRDGHHLWLESSVRVVRDPFTGQVLETINVSRDVTDRRAAVDQLAHQALYDGLTGLPNRELFTDRLRHWLARAEHTTMPVAVLFLDLDRFALVNESYGHAVGDELLVEVARRLGEAVDADATVARLGGDEFAVKVIGFTSEHEVVAVAERIADALVPPVRLATGEFFVTASIGIAISPRGSVTAESLCRDADVALARAKERGRARYELFDECMRVRARERHATENALRGALERRELRVVYQPVVSVDDGRVVGAEALVRWEHPTRGLLGPGEFVPLAEETGLIVPIGAWVLEEACAQLGRWRQQFPDWWPSVTVNLSARQFDDPELLDVVTKIMAVAGVDPASICFELTETVVMGDAEYFSEAMLGLRCLGVRLGIDDFGTGYSSLTYLKRFPVDILKIDRSFVDGLGADPLDSAIVTAVVRLAHALGIKVVAEGVETATQLRELRTLGCDLAQGYHFARPAPAVELDDLIASSRSVG